MNISQVNENSIVDFLESEGISPTKKIGRNWWYISPLRTPERTASFKVDTGINCWFDHGTGEGGKLFDLALLLFRTTDISATLQTLSGHFSNGGQSKGKIIQNKSWESKSVKVDENDGYRLIIKEVYPLDTNPVLVKYLQSRGIGIELANEHCKAVNYQIGNNHFYAVGFQNRSGGYELRNAYCKRASQPKDITLISNHAETVCVFEGFLDFLSLLSLKEYAPEKSDYLILNSIRLLSKNLSALKTYPDVRTFLDHDSSGEKGKVQLSDAGIKFTDSSEFYAGYKDVNDFLKKNELKLQKSRSGKSYKRYHR